jgi:hypothetical protein
MRVRVNIALVGAGVTANRGDEIDLPDGDAAALIKSGAVSLLRTPPIERAVKRGAAEFATREKAA